MKYAQRIIKKIIRKLSYLFFIYLPYGPIIRKNKADLKGRVILAPTHNNFYCDISIAGTETPRLPRWMAKVGLFSPLLAPWLRFLGAYPIVRILDAGQFEGDKQKVNQTSFNEILSSLRDEEAFCIFPEGNCLERPGLNLPLKNGIAKIALAAEEQNDFQLGLRIIPIGIDYSDKHRFGSRIIVRFGSEILIGNYKNLYRENRAKAIKGVQQQLTQNLLNIFPHFSSSEELLGMKILESIGLVNDRVVCSILFNKIREGNLHELQDLLNKATVLKDKYSDISFGLWAASMEWKNLDFYTKALTYFEVLFLLPLVVFSLVNNFISFFLIKKISKKLSELETDYMTIHIFTTIVLLPVLYATQFLVIQRFFFLSFKYYVFAYFAYSAISIATWVIAQKWQHKFILLLSNFWRKIPIFSARLEQFEDAVRGLEKYYQAICVKYP